MEKLRKPHFFPLKLPALPQYLNEATDPRNTIKEKDLETYGMKMVDISIKSRKDGEILWGRIQGTQYERMAHDWIYDQLGQLGFKQRVYKKMPVRVPQWHPTINDLVIVKAPSFGKGQKFRFDEAITAFPSALTPKDGVTAEMMYVGEGTASELKGRDLTGKLLLLRARTHPSVLVSSARTAYSRIATGKYGNPLGIVVWWDVPGTKQVAGRVGAPGGGDNIGTALAWTSIGNDDGYYLRKLLDRSTDKEPVIVHMNIQGQMESGKDRMSAYVYGLLPGKSGKYIILPSHVDGYFYGLHDNGAAVALNLALAKYFINMPEEKREHGIIFLFHGDHEVPGLGNTLAFVNENRELLRKDLLLVIRPEHFAMIQRLNEAIFQSNSNTTVPLMLMVSNRSPLLINTFLEASANYGITMGDFVYPDPVADEAAFHRPYNDIAAISTGWIQTTKYYHSTADMDLHAVSFKQLEKITRAHAFIIEKVFKYNRQQLSKDSYPDPKKSIYQTDLVKVILGNY